MLVAGVGSTGERQGVPLACCGRLGMVNVLRFRLLDGLGNLSVLGMLKVLGKACGLHVTGRLTPSSLLLPSPDCKGGGEAAGDEGTAGGR